MEYKELKIKKEAELQKELAESRDKLRDMRFKDANKQLKDVRAIKKIRVTIAQVLTLLNKLKKTKIAADSKTVEEDNNKEISN
jgi:ribosomal protein L29